MIFIFWFFYFPLFVILRIALFWFPPLRKRIAFENKNYTEPGCRPFKDSRETADLCFEFSSEGEYQQVASLIDDALLLGKKIELVFFSPSVEKTIRELYDKHPVQVRYFRFSIASISPFNSFLRWCSSKELILVRYDFFPQFLVWAGQKDRVLKIVWVTFKKERLRGKGVSFYKKLFLKKATALVYATEADRDLGRRLGFPGECYDFRIEQIKRRCDLRAQKFATLFSSYPEFQKLLESFPRERRLLLGNAWPTDLGLLKDLSPEVLVVIVPHRLDAEILRDIVKLCELHGRNPKILTDAFPGAGNTYVINKKGILCELYEDFGKAYVGGGFGASVHSLLEPLVSGSELISCGPVHHRSTEYDLALSYGHLSEVKSPGDFKAWASLGLPNAQSRDKMKNVFERYAQLKKEILSC